MTSEPHPEDRASMLSVEQEAIKRLRDATYWPRGEKAYAGHDDRKVEVTIGDIRTALDAIDRHQSLSRSAGGVTPPTIDAPERRVSLVALFMGGLPVGLPQNIDEMTKQMAECWADAVLSLPSDNVHYKAEFEAAMEARDAAGFLGTSPAETIYALSEELSLLAASSGERDVSPETPIYGWVTHGGIVYSGEGYPVPWRKFHIDRHSCASLLLACDPPTPATVEEPKV